MHILNIKKYKERKERNLFLTKEELYSLQETRNRKTHFWAKTKGQRQLNQEDLPKIQTLDQK